uniref:Ion_trans domain-containing protein n=1 Tax=Haemonchus placei TaxID=6290 RepID=A0A0N4VVE7_HAEPC
LHFFVAVPSSSFDPAPQKKLKTFTYTFGYIIVILRFFTIASRNSTLKMLMLTVVMGMFRSFFIITAMFLLVLFYAYTGVILFGMVKYGQAVSKYVLLYLLLIIFIFISLFRFYYLLFLFLLYYFVFYFNFIFRFIFRS